MFALESRARNTRSRPRILRDPHICALFLLSIICFNINSVRFGNRIKAISPINETVNSQDCGGGSQFIGRWRFQRAAFNSRPYIKGILAYLLSTRP